MNLVCCLRLQLRRRGSDGVSAVTSLRCDQKRFSDRSFGSLLFKGVRNSVSKYNGLTHAVTQRCYVRGGGDEGE